VLYISKKLASRVLKYLSKISKWLIKLANKIWWITLLTFLFTYYSLKWMIVGLWK